MPAEGQASDGRPGWPRATIGTASIEARNPSPFKRQSPERRETLGADERGNYSLESHRRPEAEPPCTSVYSKYAFA
jgi:hypothetical protein